MTSRLRAACLGLAVGLGAFATTLGLIGRGDAAGAGASLAVALAAGALAFRRSPRHAAAHSLPRFAARAAWGIAAAWAVLVPTGWLLGRALVAATWEDPRHSQAGLQALLVGLWYGTAWAPAAGVWWAVRIRPAGGDTALRSKKEVSP